MASIGRSDSANGDGDNFEGTQCELSYNESNASGKDFGEACTTNAECQFGECMMPGDTGNITNEVFGFCTRGCDCEDNTAAQIPDELKDGFLDCLYPSDSAGGLKDFHHVVVECSDISACTALAPGWTSCRLPDTGGARKVCHADAP